MKAFVWIVMLAWAAFLYWGWKATTTGSASLCTLVRDFPQNHLLATGDFKCASSGVAALYSGLYLRNRLNKDNHLTPENVSVSPLLSIAPDSTVFAVDASIDDANKRDAGQKLDLGTGSSVIAKQNRVIAVLCSSKISQRCEVMFEIPQSTLKELVNATGRVRIVDNLKVVPQQTDASAKQDPGKAEMQIGDGVAKQSIPTQPKVRL